MQVVAQGVSEGLVRQIQSNALLWVDRRVQNLGIEVRYLCVKQIRLFTTGRTPPLESNEKRQAEREILSLSLAGFVIYLENCDTYMEKAVDVCVTFLLYKSACSVVRVSRNMCQ